MSMLFSGDDYDALPCNIREDMDARAVETAELKRIIRELIEVMDFDAENCDFGPAYGMWEKRKKKALTDARRATK